MTDLEKIEKIIGMLGLGIERHTKEYEIEIAVYDWNKYKGSIYFTLDGTLLTWDY